MITTKKSKPEESARALDNGLSPLPNGDFEFRAGRVGTQPPRVTKASYPSIRQTRYSGFVITQGTITRTFFKRTAGLAAIAFYQTLLARQLEGDQS
jgi:hypothetical protein